MTASRQARAEGWGVPKSLKGSQSSDRRHPHAQIFFLVPGVLIQSYEIKPIKSRIISTRGHSGSFQRCDLFSEAPGGGQKVFRSLPRTGELGARIFSGISENFFSSSDDLRKVPRNSGWGGR